jgi:hypothetical protein
MLQHSRIHTGDRPFKCTHCDYCTSRKSVLREHIKTHTKSERPYHQSYRGLVVFLSVPAFDGELAVPSADSHHRFCQGCPEQRTTGPESIEAEEDAGAAAGGRASNGGRLARSNSTHLNRMVFMVPSAVDDLPPQMVFHTKMPPDLDPPLTSLRPLT